MVLLLSSSVPGRHDHGVDAQVHWDDIRHQVTVAYHGAQNALTAARQHTTRPVQIVYPTSRWGG